MPDVQENGQNALPKSRRKLWIAIVVCSVILIAAAGIGLHVLLNAQRDIVSWVNEEYDDIKDGSEGSDGSDANRTQPRDEL